MFHAVYFCVLTLSRQIRERTSTSVSETENTSPLNKPVFYTSSIIIACLLIFAAALPETADSLFKTIQSVIVTNGSWFYVLTVAIVLLFVGSSSSWYYLQFIVNVDNDIIYELFAGGNKTPQNLSKSAA